MQPSSQPGQQCFCGRRVRLTEHPAILQADLPFQLSALPLPTAALANTSSKAFSFLYHRWRLHQRPHETYSAAYRMTVGKRMAGAGTGKQDARKQASRRAAAQQQAFHVGLKGKPEAKKTNEKKRHS